MRRNEQLELLLSVLERRASHMVGLFRTGIGKCTVPQIDEALGALEKELVEFGFDEDWEPTSRGLEIEEVIGALVQQRIAREQARQPKER